MNDHRHDIDETLLLKFLLGQTSDGENHAVTDWLDQDPAHRYILEKLESVWLETGKLIPVPVAVDIEKAWLKLTDRIDFGATDPQAGTGTGDTEPVGPSQRGMKGIHDAAFDREAGGEGTGNRADKGAGTGTGDPEPVGPFHRGIQGSRDDAFNRETGGGGDGDRVDIGAGTLPRQGPDLGKTSPGNIQGRQLRMYALRIAATLVILAGIYLVIFLLTRPASEVVITAATGHVTDTIPDGTIITLQQGSTLSYSSDFNENERRIRLSGEAFFAVTRDAEKPFVIEAGGAGVRVLGTSFLVKVINSEERETGRHNGKLTMDNGQWTIENGKLKPAPSGASAWLATTVRVEHGRVMLFRVDERSGDTASLILETGMRGTISKGMKTPVLSDTAQPDEMFWKDRSLDFRQTPLREVIDLVGKLYGIAVAVERTEVLECRLTASFRDESPEQIVSVIAASFNLGVRRTQSGYLLSGPGCLEEGGNN